MTRIMLFCVLVAAALASGSRSDAANMSAPSAAPAGGQTVAAKFSKTTIPEGWNWILLHGAMLLTASPNVPAEFFNLADVPLTDNMANCFDLSHAQDERSPGLREEYLNSMFVSYAEKLSAVTDEAARQASFVEWRDAGGNDAIVAILPEVVGANIEFTGTVNIESAAASHQLICKAMFARDKGAYGEREAMKALRQVLSGFAPL